MRTPIHHSGSTALATLILMTAAVAAAEGRAQKSKSATGRPANAVRTIVVSIPDRKLALLEGDSVLAVFDTAVGKAASPSPTGTFTIVNRLTSPTYYAPGKIVEPGERNPLGTRWIGLSVRGYGIHGTNSARSIGRAASHGCIRMRNREIEELFDLVQVGDIVELHSQSSDRLARIFWPAQSDLLQTAQLQPPNSAIPVSQ
jgi:lipoprotein-anchoring transpeptidase ErfK/SrfK